MHHGAHPHRSQGAKLFPVSGVEYGKWYARQDVFHIARYISTMKFRPLVWRSRHSYFLADRVEEVPSADEDARQDAA